MFPALLHNGDIKNEWYETPLLRLCKARKLGLPMTLVIIHITH